MGEVTAETLFARFMLRMQLNNLGLITSSQLIEEMPNFEMQYKNGETAWF